MSPQVGLAVHTDVLTLTRRVLTRTNSHLVRVSLLVSLTGLFYRPLLQVSFTVPSRYVHDSQRATDAHEGARLVRVVAAT